MNKQALVILVGVAVIGGGAYMLQNNSSDETSVGNVTQGLVAAAGGAGELPALEEQWDMVYDYCVDCHNEADYTGGLSLEYSVADLVHEEGEIWEEAITKLKVRQMPPRGEPQPTEEQRQIFIASLEAILDQEALDNPNPGAPVLPRLNRTEYQNAIRDTLDFDVDASTLLAADDSADGFDNMSSALTVSPALLEGYVAASGNIAGKAIGDVNMSSDFVTYRTAPDLSQDIHVPGAPIGTQGGVVFEHYFPLDGEYEFTPKLYRGVQDDMKGLEFTSTLEISIDKERVHLAAFGGQADVDFSEENDLSKYDMGLEIDARLQSRIFVTAGMHKVSVAFLRRPPSPSPEIWKHFKRTAIDSNEAKGVPHLDKVDIRGPFNATGTGTTASREKIFTCEPSLFNDEERLCAAEILTNLANQAYRRPVTETEMSDLMGFYELGSDVNGFEKGIETGIRRIISGPEFLFRAEDVPAGVPQGGTYEINELDLASRLSFFLWSSLPDEELRSLAIAGNLRDPGVLEGQVMRMLEDPKAENLTYNFATQWLTLRNLQGIIPDPELFPDYDQNLRQSSILESQLLFKSIVDEDRNVLDLITADYTFVNERLADLYDMPNVYGTRMRRVAVEDERRRGILGHSSIQTLTSASTRTSAVIRGKWVLENLIATPPPAAPNNVPSLEESETDTPSTLREQLARHRADPFCTPCHKMMDPIGFAMEKYDAIGRYRQEDNGLEIETDDIMFDGTGIDGINDLRQYFIEHDEILVNTLTQKLLAFSLARPLEYFDKPAVRKITRYAAENENRFSSIVLGIVNSIPFQMRKNGEAESEQVAINQ